MEVADRVVVMNRGRIEQIGDAQTLYTKPASPFVCRFLGEVNELPPALHAMWTGVRDADAIAFVRPHDLDLIPAAAAYSPARVETVRDLGATMRIEVRHPAIPAALIVIQERRRFAENALAPGEAVAISAKRWVIFRSGDSAG